jgi:hypothetical protein
MSKLTINLPVRKVTRLTPDGHYVVVEQADDGAWTSVSKFYPHSTSAFAALGRLTQKDTEKLVPNEVDLA